MPFPVTLSVGALLNFTTRSAGKTDSKKRSSPMFRVRATTIAVFVVLATNIHAQILTVSDHLDRVAGLIPAHAAMTIGEAINRTFARHSTRVVPNVLLVDARDTAFLIPIAGSAAGANGTYF